MQGSVWFHHISLAGCKKLCVAIIGPWGDRAAYRRDELFTGEKELSEGRKFYLVE